MTGAFGTPVISHTPTKYFYNGPLPQKYVFQIYVLRSYPAALGEAFY